MSEHKEAHPLVAEYDRGDGLLLFDDFLDLMTRLVDPKLEIDVLQQVADSESKRLYTELKALFYRNMKLLVCIVAYFLGYLIIFIIDIYLITNSSFPKKLEDKLKVYREAMLTIFDYVRPFPLYLLTNPLKFSFDMVNIIDVDIPVGEGVTCSAMNS